MKSSRTITISFIRHGTTEHNERKIFQGHSDGPDNALSEKGKRQIEEYSERFDAVPIDAIFSSDLTRSRQTAEVIAKHHNLTVNTNPLLRGKRMGHFEGVSVKEYLEKNGEALKKFQTLPENEQWKHKIDIDMESNEEVLNRLMVFLKKIHRNFSGDNILIVTHGGTIRNLLFHLGWAKQHELKTGSVDNGGFITVTFDGNNFQLKEIVGVTKNFVIS